MTDWIMISITGVYVIATILICIFNYRSAKATREQVSESKRQFEEGNRAFVTVTLEVVRHGLAVLRIQNHGKRIAQNVGITICHEFIDAIPKQRERDHLEKFSKSIFSIGIGQSWYVSLGSIFEAIRIKDVIDVDLTYKDSTEKYSEQIQIDLQQYRWTLIYDSPVAEIREEMKNEIKGLREIKQSIDKLSRIQSTLIDMNENLESDNFKFDRKISETQTGAMEDEESGRE